MQDTSLHGMHWGVHHNSDTRPLDTISQTAPGYPCPCLADLPSNPRTPEAQCVGGIQLRCGLTCWCCTVERSLCFRPCLPLVKRVATCLDIPPISSRALQTPHGCLLSHPRIFGVAAYFKSWWPWLDVLAAAGGWTQLLPGDNTDVSGLRVLRALRILRDMSSMPGLMLLVQSLVESIPLLRDVMLLLFWMLAIFGIIGMQLFARRCALHSADACSLQCGMSGSCRQCSWQRNLLPLVPTFRSCSGCWPSLASEACSCTLSFCST